MIGPDPEIRTRNFLFLRETPLPIGSDPDGVHERIRTSNIDVLDVVPLPVGLRRRNGTGEGTRTLNLLFLRQAPRANWATPAYDNMLHGGFSKKNPSGLGWGRGIHRVVMWLMATLSPTPVADSARANMIAAGVGRINA